MCPLKAEKHCRITAVGERHVITRQPPRTSMSDTVRLSPKSFLDMLWAAEVSLRLLLHQLIQLLTGLILGPQQLSL